MAEIFEHNIRIILNGKERFDAEEYCISEGWVKVPSPKVLDRRGQPLMMTLKGTVEASYSSESLNHNGAKSITICSVFR